MKLTKEEMETIINFNEADTKAEIEVFSARLLREIRKAAEMYPDEVTITESTDGAYVASFPKKWVKIRAPRKLSEAQMEHLKKIQKTKEN